VGGIDGEGFKERIRNGGWEMRMGSGGFLDLLSPFMPTHFISSVHCLVFLPGRVRVCTRSQRKCTITIRDIY
jgi:hypothetical protein